MAEKTLWVRIGADISQFKSELQKAEGYLQAHKEQFRKIGLGVTAVGAGLTAFFAKAVKEYAGQEVANEKLINALKNVKGASADGAQALLDQAGALQTLTGYQDDQIVNAQAMLATFQLTDEQIKAITPRLIDMAAATEKSTGQQADLQSIAIALGKGFTGLAGSLSRYGVVLSEETKKSGDFNAILNDLDKNFKGAGETVGKTFTGQMRIMKAAVGDALEPIGEKLVPMLNSLMGKITQVATSVFDWMQKHEKLMKVLVPALAIFGGIATVLGPLLIILPSLAAGFSMLTGPVGLVIAAITGLIAIGALIVKNWDEIKAFLISCWEGIKSAAVTTWNAIKQFFVSIFEGIKFVFSTAFQAIETVIETYLTMWKTIITTGITALVSVFGWLKDNVIIHVQNLVTGVIEKFLGLFTRVKEIFNQIKDKIVGAFKSAWHAVVGGSIVPTMTSQILDQFAYLRTGVLSEIKAIEDGTTQAFFRISDYAQAMQSTTAEAGASMSKNLRASGKMIIDTLRREAIAFIIEKVMAALPFPINLAAVGAAIAAVNTLFGAIKLAEGGIVTRPMLALVGEAGPEAVIPLDKASRTWNPESYGREINMTVNFYGDVHNAGDIDQISNRLADRLNQVVRGGRL